ncbi:peptidase [Streptomyces sp. NPDC000410]|uniref:peptidase n=1 Tax=Streptomyces sp. NPDC000410 TaxID=3154254 RepID=UPI00331F6357
MKIRHVLATAVAAAVTAPAVLLSATPALADTKPAPASQAEKQQAGKPSIEELEKAAAKAQKAYDDAVAAEKAANAAVDAAFADDAPHAVEARAATQEAADAEAAKKAADQALVDAEAALAALPETATDEEKAAAAEAVTDAEAAVEAAKAVQTAADEKAAQAREAANDIRIAALRAQGQAEIATADALKAKNAADKALADAKAEQGEEDGEDGEGDDEDGGDDACVPENDLTTVATGLPSKIVAGSTVNFSVRVTNGTDKTLDKVTPFAYFHATDKSGLKVVDDMLQLQWSTAGSPEWQTVEVGEYAGSISPLKAGAHADVKLRLKVDAKAPAGNGIAFIAGDYFNNDGSCGGNLANEYEFELLAAGSKPGKVDDAKPGKATTVTSDLKPQGGATTTTTGSLANTGSPSALPQLAAAAGAAVALGAGAVLIVRRRKADSAS